MLDLQQNVAKEKRFIKVSLYILPDLRPSFFYIILECACCIFLNLHLSYLLRDRVGHGIWYSLIGWTGFLASFKDLPIFALAVVRFWTWSHVFTLLLCHLLISDYSKHGLVTCDPVTLRVSLRWQFQNDYLFLLGAQTKHKTTTRRLNVEMQT